MEITILLLGGFMDKPIELDFNDNLPSKIEITASIVEDTDGDHQLAVTMKDSRYSESGYDWYQINFCSDGIKEETIKWLAIVLARDMLEIVEKAQKNIKGHFQIGINKALNIIGLKALK